MNIKIKNNGLTQQPHWPDLEQVNQITKMIKEYPNLVSVKEIINKNVAQMHLRRWFHIARWRLC